MSQRELKALLADQKQPQTVEQRSQTRSTRGQKDSSDNRESEEVAQMEALTAQVEQLQQQLTETQTALEASDKELQRVSSECERMSEQLRVAQDLANSLSTLTGSGPASLKTFFESFLESQTKLIATQTNALAVQSAPPLESFSGEEVEIEERSFDKWLKRFEERATLLSWSESQKCYQLKTHLTKIALQVFDLLTTEQQNNYSELVSALKARFKPVDIEELRGFEFHQLMQKDESVEQLGLKLMTLAKKAFPSIGSKELDRLLKGRFYQALLPKWQRKLGAPKVSESFSELYERARTCERHDQQYRGRPKEHSRGKDHKRHENASSPTNDDQVPSTEPNPHRPKRQSTLRCFNCKGVGHFRRNCPELVADKSEAPGKSTPQPTPLESKTAMVGVTATPRTDSDDAKAAPVSSLSDEQLEEILASRRCLKEQGLLDTSEGQVGIVVTKGPTAAIGATLELDIKIEGVELTAMIDTGSQSSIISRNALHKIGAYLREQGKPVPKLQPASARLFGKDGKAGKHELKVTAQVTLNVEADGISVPVLLFIQPDSSQECLIGMNAAPALGLSFLNARGQPLRRATVPTTQSSRVSLITCKEVSARASSFVEARVEEDLAEGVCVLFEPDPTSLERHGLGAPEALLQVNEQGKVLIPVMNYQQKVVHLDSGTKLGCVEIVPNADDSCSARPSGDNESIDTMDEEIADAEINTGSVASVSADPESRKQCLLETLEFPDHLEPDQLDALKQLVAEYDDVFALDDEDLGCTDTVKHTIDTGDHPPIKQHPRRTPFVQRAKIASMISDMEKKGIIKSSTSPWASPVVLVPKKDGTTRFCIDYRRLNAVTKKDVYPLPRIEDILDTIGRAKYFTTLDLSAGYWQTQLDPSTSEKTAFTTHCGLFEFNRMPFGLCNAPSTFQRLMQNVLSGLEWKCCFVYIDDILVCSRTFEDHIAHLRSVFERLRAANLKLKVKKSSFLRTKVSYLGHTISKYGIAPDPSKTVKVQNFPVPTDVTKLRQFLGLASYYRRFIPNFAKVSGPLHALTKKGARYEWTVSCQEAFDHLKQLLCSAPVLAYPQFGPGHEFILETDASLAGLGAVLSQKDDKGRLHPVAYASRTLHKHEQNYPITELETLGVVWAVKHFRAYLLGHHCTVLTDHAACTSLLHATHPSAKLARWAMIIQEMDLDIRHRAGKTNHSADALSRNPLPEVVVSSVEAVTTQLREDQYGDVEFKVMIDYLNNGTLPSNDSEARKVVLHSKSFDMIDDILHHENPNYPGRWCVAIPQTKRTNLIREAHDGRFSGHFAEKRIYELLRRRYWWPKMRSDVRTYCRSCLVCASRKGTGHAIRPALQPIPVGGPFHRVGVDVLQLPLSFDGNQYAVVFIDYLTKWVEVFAVPDQKAETIARLFVEGVVCRHGAPQELLSDRGTNFMSELMSEVCKLFDVKKLNTSGYHPQTNGLCERFNSTLIQILSKTGERYGHDWDRHLPYVLYAYRVSVQESTKESPFFLLYGRDPALPTLNALSYERTPYMIDLDDYKTELMTGLNGAWKLAKENITFAQQRQKKTYDRNATEHTVKVGQRVMVHMPNELHDKTWKFARPFHGPFRIVSLTPTNAEVKLIDEPNSSTIFVSLNRVRPCYDELPDVSWKGTSPKRYFSRQTTVKPTTDSRSDHAPYTGPMTRSRSKNSSK